jgi:hypothetical protein
MLRASDATGIPFVELLESLWGIKSSRLAGELGRLGAVGSGDGVFDRLTEAERTSVAAYVGFLASRHIGRGRQHR